ncbi:hypothetical protein [Undibacterium sp. Ji49W]
MLPDGVSWMGMEGTDVDTCIHGGNDDTEKRNALALKKLKQKGNS